MNIGSDVSGYIVNMDVRFETNGVQSDNFDSAIKACSADSKCSGVYYNPITQQYNVVSGDYKLVRQEGAKAWVKDRSCPPITKRTDSDLPGSDINGSNGFYAETERACSAACCANTTCKAYTFDTRNGVNTCWLKSDIPTNSIDLSGVMSGARSDAYPDACKPSRLYNRDLSGNNILNNGIINTGNVDECEMTCCRRNDCVAYTFDGGKCYLKNSLPTATTDKTGAVSGIKNSFTITSTPLPDAVRDLSGGTNGITESIKIMDLSGNDPRRFIYISAASLGGPSINSGTPISEVSVESNRTEPGGFIIGVLDDNNTRIKMINVIITRDKNGVFVRKGESKYTDTTTFKSLNDAWLGATSASYTLNSIQVTATATQQKALKTLYKPHATFNPGYLSLTQHQVKCREGGLNRVALGNLWDVKDSFGNVTGTSRYRMQYDCGVALDSKLDAEMPVAKTATKSITFSGDISGAHDLSGVNVNCEQGGVLTGFNLVRPSNDTQRIQYEYTCRKATASDTLYPRILNTVDAPFDTDAGNIANLDRFPIQCDRDEALGQFQFVGRPNKRMAYTYTCVGAQAKPTVDIANTGNTMNGYIVKPNVRFEANGVSDGDLSTSIANCTVATNGSGVYYDPITQKYYVVRDSYKLIPQQGAKAWVKNNSTCSTSMTTQSNKDLRGNDIGGIYADSEEVCKAACCANSNCVGYSFDTRQGERGANTCYLKNALPANSTAAPGINSAVKPPNTFPST
jgi:hypothetical protein